MRSIDASAIDPRELPYARNDNFTATVTYGDGSVASLMYTALGPKAGLGKEHITVFCDGEAFIVDDFKKLNDSLGHPAGDAALKHVAYLLEAAVRDGDLVARIGGEEFAVWLPRTPLAPGLEVAERIRESIAGSTWMWRSSPYIVTTSCGVAAYPEPIGDLTNLRAAADAALYRAKQAGRNRVERA